MLHTHSFLKTEKEPSEYKDGFYQETFGNLWALQLSLKYVHNEINTIFIVNHNYFPSNNRDDIVFIVLNLYVGQISPMGVQVKGARRCV